MPRPFSRQYFSQNKSNVLMEISSNAVFFLGSRGLVIRMIKKSGCLVIVGAKCNWARARSLFVILLIFALCIFTLVAVYHTDWKDDNLKWEDNFDFLDDRKWSHVVTGNRGNDNQFQYYRKDRRNSFVENGTLRLKATIASDELTDEEIRTGYQNFPGCNVQPCLVHGKPDGDCLLPVYSAQIHTRNLFEVKSGRVEVKAKFPAGDWLRAEIALLPSENAYGGWQTSGEIRIADGCGNKKLTTLDGHSIGRNTVRQSLSWSPGEPYNSSYYNRNKKTHWETSLLEGDFSQEFHVFEVLWSGGRIAFKVDGSETGKIVPPQGGFWELGGFSGLLPDILNPWRDGTVMAPFDRAFYLVLRLFVGGSFFEDAATNSGYEKPWDLNSGRPITQFYESQRSFLPTWEKPELEIDYIRVYEH